MAIRPENLIRKLSFAYYGQADEQHLVALRTEMLEKSRKFEGEGRPYASRTAIYRWFPLNGDEAVAPKKPGAHLFIYHFVVEAFESIEAARLSDERKKVARQLRAFCKKAELSAKRRMVHGNDNGSFNVRTETIFDRKMYIDEIKYLSGYYSIYRNRFGPVTENGNDLSVEYAKIFAINNFLYIDWWFLIDDQRLEKFEGVAYFVGQWVWFKLFNPALGGRFRVGCFNRTGWGRKYPRVYEGLLFSTTPHPATPVPAAVRVVFEEADAPAEDHAIKSMVQHIPSYQLRSSFKEAILSTLREKQQIPGRLDSVSEHIDSLQR